MFEKVLVSLVVTTKNFHFDCQQFFKLTEKSTFLKFIENQKELLNENKINIGKDTILAVPSVVNTFHVHVASSNCGTGWSLVHQVAEKKEESFFEY